MASRRQPCEQSRFRRNDASEYLAMISAGVLLLSVLRLCSINDHRTAQTISDGIPRQFIRGNEVSERSCGGRLTAWLSKKNQPPKDGHNYGNTRHVSECRSCCACDWEAMQVNLAADTDKEFLMAISEVETQQTFLQSDSTVGHQVISSTGEIESPSTNLWSHKKHLQDSSGWNSSLSVSGEEIAWDPWLSSNMNGNAMPDCDVCHGCSHVVLPPLRYYYGFNFTFKALPQEREGTQTWRAYSSTSAASSFHYGHSVHSAAPFLIKLWTCSKAAYIRKGLAANHQHCPRLTELQGLFARSQLFGKITGLFMRSHSREGPLTDMHAKVAKTWIANVNAVLPGDGTRVAGQVLASYLPVGVPAVRLLNHPWPWVPLQAVRQISSKSLLAAAVLDVLTLNCNRDLDDVFFDESGNFELVNNDHVFGSTADGKRCLTNSIFIPYSRNFKVAAHGLAYASGIASTPRQAPHLAQLLDYRCHVGEGRTSLGTEYPKDIKSFLEGVAKIQTPVLGGSQAGSSMMAQNIATKRLVTRANDMLMKGFEWTILHAESAATGPAGMPQSNSDVGLPDMCCSMKIMSNGNVHCA